MTKPSPRPSPVGWLLVTFVLIGAGLLLLVPPFVQAMAPEDFRSRQDLPQCPAVTVPQGATTSESSWDCLLDADAHRRGAEVEVVTPTAEGDPITSYYRRLPGRPGLEVFISSSQDTFGSGGWEHVWCPEATSPDDLGACRPA
ncbi:hypothetical protein CLV92_11670 [Kineococcus xinjiangensis]|uniref:Uncharacterized protein n=1 Tax=Kineococcus xinjiangensis TaxID=512762 RepID=A0A2S6IDB1_9ACTN|nr:hypothetical protein [Kineococcus xinjiangensis]PPK92208.1 hypothetical protein CLV92_11670 [Kineococcus xinjiangensis]